MRAEDAWKRPDPVVIACVRRIETLGITEMFEHMLIGCERTLRADPVMRKAGADWTMLNLRTAMAWFTSGAIEMHNRNERGE